jgi:hypothetical protein
VRNDSSPGGGSNTIKVQKVHLFRPSLSFLVEAEVHTTFFVFV